MTTPKLTPPLLIAFTAQGNTQKCMGAKYSGDGALISLNAIKWNEGGPQLWQFGNDDRIYLHTPESPAAFCVGFSGAPTNGLQLQLSVVEPSDKMQMWDWNTQPGYILNIGAGGFAIDNNDGRTGPENRIQIWEKGNTPHQIWTPEMMPSYYLKSLVSKAATAAG
jgi:hypothetical protein